jgi:hypothetical protein
MPLTQAKPIKEVFTSEPQFQPRGPQGNNTADPACIKYFGGTGQSFGDRGKRC